MAYCINPHCPEPENTNDAELCDCCGTALRFGQSQIQALGAFLPDSNKNKSHQKRLYHVIDQHKREGVMEVFDDAIKPLAEMFARISNLLRLLQHPGIPQYFEQFTLITPAGKRLNCLVRERIEGQDLQSLLESQGAIAVDQAIHWLGELCHILDEVHRKGSLHLDIKPANIILRTSKGLTLIDFSEGAESLSAGYSPMEQADNQPQAQSDFYALGRTMVHLLTGQHPLEIPQDQATGALQWETLCPSLPSDFRQLINQMMAKDIEQRPQSTQAILTALDKLAPRRSIRILTLPHPILLSTSCLGILLGFGLAWIIPPQVNPLRISVSRLLNPQNNIACYPQQAMNLSCGGRSLIPGRANTEENKSKGLTAYGDKKYDDAVHWFKQARLKQPLDPELVIFENNARIKQADLKSYTIVIAAPLSVKGLPNYILRGVAQLQTEVNQSPEKIHGRSLQILLANDGNSNETAINLAKQIVPKQNVVGVVGHYASEISLATLPYYQRAQIPVVSFGSTSKELSCNNLLACPQNVFYRVVSTTTAEARNLATHAKTQNIHQRVAVLFNARSSFSNSLKSEFDAVLKTTGGKIVSTFNPCQQEGGFETQTIQAQLAKAKVTAIALLPDGQTCKTSLDNTIEFANRTEGQYPILNSWTFDSPGIFRRLSQPVFAQMITGAPWHALSQPDSEFNRIANSVWGQEIFATQALTGVSATAYDAAKVIVTALQAIEPNTKPPQVRAELLKVLKDPEFRVTGETGEIQFMGSDRRNSNLVLLRAKLTCPGDPKALVPIHYDERREPSCSSR